jgi:hypothetical protein
MALHPHGQVRCEASNAQDALMIGKTSRAVAMKHSRADGAADQINRLMVVVPFEPEAQNSDLRQICANFGLRTLAADRGRFVVALYSSATIEDPGIALGDCLMQSEKIGLQLSRGPRLQLEMMEAVFASH